MNYLLNVQICLIVFILLSGSVYSQERDSANIINYYALDTDLEIPETQSAIASGEQLFARHCNECHAFCSQSIGPALASVTERRPLVWLLAFIKNPRNVINQGDPYANHLFQQYGNKLMPEFDRLMSDQEILNILGYIQEKSDGEFNVSTGEPYEPEKVAPQYGEEYATEYYQNDSVLDFPMDNERILKGKQLFQDHCQICHEFCSSEQGPALSSVTDRRPLTWLTSFIKNPQRMIDEGDSYAQHLHSNYNLVMPPFDFLEDEDIIDILAYIRDATSAPVHIAGSVSGRSQDSQNADEEGPYSHIDTSREIHGAERRPSWISIASYSLLGLGTIALLIFLLSRVWKKL